MEGRTKVAPVLIKRKKIIAGGGHHGGAWKVAYADFVTAMMAFFLLMWLLNATTENQRKGLADYFNPTIAVNRISGGGNDMLNGETVFSEQSQVRTGTGATHMNPTLQRQAEGTIALMSEDAALLEDAASELLGAGGESILEVNDRRHVDLRLTDEGLVIELFDLPEAPLFDDAHAPTDIAIRLLGAIATFARDHANPAAIETHVRAAPVVMRDNPAWANSETRARTIREAFVLVGFDADRLARSTAHADRERVSENPFSERNNRVEIVFLRATR